MWQQISSRKKLQQIEKLWKIKVWIQLRSNWFNGSETHNRQWLSQDSLCLSSSSPFAPSCCILYTINWTEMSFSTTLQYSIDPVLLVSSFTTLFFFHSLCLFIVDYFAIIGIYDFSQNKPTVFSSIWIVADANVQLRCVFPGESVSSICKCSFALFHRSSFFYFSIFAHSLSLSRQ